MQRMLAIIFSVFASLIYAQNGIPFRDDGFDRNRLLRDTAEDDGGSFYISGSYTLSYVSARRFSQMSGVYLSTLTYQFDFPLEISMDIGAENVFFHNEKEKPPYPTDSRNTKNPGLLLPRIGLEYHPTPNTSFSFQIINIPDAIRAYGPWRYWDCDPYNRIYTDCSALRHYRY